MTNTENNTTNKDLEKKITESSEKIKDVISEVHKKIV